MKKIILFILILTSLQGIGQTKVAAPLVTNSPLDSTYGTHFDSLGYGGYVAFSSIANRNAFPSALRKRGMSAGVKDSIGIIWQLQGGILNSNWSRFVLGSAGTGGVTNAYNNIDSSVDNQRVILKKENGEPADTIIFRFVGGSGGGGGTLSRFGIEDSTSVQNRTMNLVGNSLLINLNSSGEKFFGLFNNDRYESFFEETGTTFFSDIYQDQEGVTLASTSTTAKNSLWIDRSKNIRLYSLGTLNGGVSYGGAGVPSRTLQITPRATTVKRTGTGYDGVEKEIVTSVNGIPADSTGNITIAAGGGTTETASNGLTKVGNDIQLGGLLTKSDTINTATNRLVITGAQDQHTIFVENTGIGFAANFVGVLNGIQSTSLSTGIGVSGTSLSGNGVYGSSTDNSGVYGGSTNSYGLQAYAQEGIPIYAYKANGFTTGVAEMFKLSRGSSGTTTNDFGSAFTLNLQSNINIERQSNAIISKWSNATDASRTSEFSITGVDNGVTKTLVQISGAGLVRLTQGAPEYADNAAALTAGLPIGTIYRTGDNLKIVR